MALIRLDVELDSFSTEDLVDELEGRGYVCTKKEDQEEELSVKIYLLLDKHHYSQFTAEQVVQSLYEMQEKIWCKN